MKADTTDIRTECTGLLRTYGVLVVLFVRVAVAQVCSCAIDRPRAGGADTHTLLALQHSMKKSSVRMVARTTRIRYALLRKVLPGRGIHII